jgi:hypothetical protein
MIKANRQVIKTLTGMPDAEKFTLDAYARYQLAGNVADADRVFANVLSVVGGAGIVPENLENGADYRLEASDIAKNIPIAVKVDNDRSNRIGSAFAAALSREGFRTGGSNSRYVLDVKISFSPVDLPNQQNKFVRYVVDANLTDVTAGNVLLPYNINGREGHISVVEAENRSLVAAERKINEAYGKALQDYFSTQMPAHK